MVLGVKTPPPPSTGDGEGPVLEEELRDLIHVLEPLDLAGSREQSPAISLKKLPDLRAHLTPSDTDSATISSMKRAASQELCIMKAASTIDECKEIVGYLNRSGLRNKLPTTTKQEVETRWNSYRMMLSSVEQQWTEVKPI